MFSDTLTHYSWDDSFLFLNSSVIFLSTNKYTLVAAMKGTDRGYSSRERPRTPMIKEIDRLPGMSHSGNSFRSSVSKTHIHAAEGALVQHKRPMAQASSPGIGLFKSPGLEFNPYDLIGTS